MISYSTIQGDTWSGIAFRLYGDEKYMVDLMEANPKYIQTVIFQGNVQLVVPSIPVERASTLPPWKE